MYLKYVNKTQLSLNSSGYKCQNTLRFNEDLIILCFAYNRIRRIKNRVKIVLLRVIFRVLIFLFLSDLF